MAGVREFTIKFFYLFYIWYFSKLNIGEKSHWPRGTTVFWLGTPVLKRLLLSPSLGTSHQYCWGERSHSDHPQHLKVTTQIRDAQTHPLREELVFVVTVLPSPSPEHWFWFSFSLLLWTSRTSFCFLPRNAFFRLFKSWCSSNTWIFNFSMVTSFCLAHIWMCASLASEEMRNSSHCFCSQGS